MIYMSDFREGERESEGFQTLGFVRANLEK